jgi:hypothetical protein
MGRMYPPDEVAQEYLPPREIDGETDYVGKFGAWLTGGGAAVVATVACAIPAVGGLIDLLKWVFGNFQDNFIIGFLSIIGAIWVCSFAMIILYVYYLIIYALVWLFGWVCYNTWTLLACICVVVLWFQFLRY